MANGIRTGDSRSSVKVPEFDKHLKKAGGHIGRNVVEITMKTLNDKNSRKIYKCRMILKVDKMEREAFLC